MKEIVEKYVELKQKSVSHSPSIQTILEEIPEQLLLQNITKK
tara:strand:+ start:1697 stop:1822 length:126 start_codon:yes stop_codon:yes gene_type:complete